ncbi:hypothetical protein CPPEL_03460 [Corynebacterium pseudopelargi]|uniref:Uncharacterized protein n=1 Tax=Corynebacterium pseudopelargi TaxID=2080757 RepID=A0A3G6IT75_9CORY|nr:hypothetical protein CPPEL_03460 [Corynebacterium pseudopelargi]
MGLTWRFTCPIAKSIFSVVYLIVRSDLPFKAFESIFNLERRVTLHILLDNSRPSVCDRY